MLWLCYLTIFVVYLTITSTPGVSNIANRRTNAWITTIPKRGSREKSRMGDVSRVENKEVRGIV